jgi:hypothetical protein
MELVRNKHIFSIYHMKYGDVGSENGCFMTANTRHAYSFAHPEQREESNPEDVSKNSNTTIAQEPKETISNSYLGSVAVSMS